MGKFMAICILRVICHFSDHNYHIVYEHNIDKYSLN